MKESKITEYFFLFDYVLDGIAIADTKSKKFLTGNRAICNMLGYTPEEFKRLGVMDIHPKERLPHVIEQFEKQAKKEITLAKNIPVLRKDGSVFYADIVSNPIELDSNEYLVGIFRDVTETQNLLNQLQNSKKKYQDLIENIYAMVWEQDIEGRFTYISPRAKDILGYEPKELLGKTPFDIMPEEESKTRKELFYKTVKSKPKTLNLEDELIHKSGKTVTASISVSTVFDESGSIIGFKGLTTDITEQKELEKELKQKEELIISQSRQTAMADMIAMIAHQWRQPLTVAGMAVNNIKIAIQLGEEITPSKLDKMTDLITDQIQHLSETIDDFRTFFRKEEEKKRTTVSKVLDDAIKLIDKSLQSSSIALDFSKRCDTHIETFPNELMQVFLNIILNALDAVRKTEPENPIIKISVIEDKGSIITSICDNGGGIPEDIINSIAEPYFSTKEVKSDGLGLYMSKIIIEKNLNGKLKWENEYDEKGDRIGACFIIALPIEKEMK